MKDNIYINNGIADKEGPSYRVYALLRSLDDVGSGHVVITITAIATMLGLSRKTIRRNLFKGRKKGFYRFLEVIGDAVEVYYTSTLELKRRDSGLRALVPMALALNNLKEVATRAEACARTRRHHAKLRRLPRRRRSDEMHGKQILTYDNLLADNCRWARVHRNGVCIIHPQLVHTGASQQTVANALGRHRRTVNRRLKFCNEHLCAQPHLRVHRLHNLSDLPGEVQDGLMDNSRFGKYTLAPGGVVWENSTCIYPFEPFAFDEPLEPGERERAFTNLSVELAIRVPPSPPRVRRRRAGGVASG